MHFLSEARSRSHAAIRRRSLTEGGTIFGPSESEAVLPSGGCLFAPYVYVREVILFLLL